MSLRLLIDEDSQAKLLIRLLRNAGHNILTVSEASLDGMDDATVLDYSRKENRVLLTHNCKDFNRLHQFNSIHPGILAVYRGDNSTKNMPFKAIVKAISNLETASIPLSNQFINLNHWHY